MGNGNGCCAGRDDVDREEILSMQSKRDSIRKSDDNFIYRHNGKMRNIETLEEDRNSINESLVIWGYLYPKSRDVKHGVIQLYENETVIGRDDKRCDVVLSHAYISGVHALISCNLNYGSNIDSSSHIGMIYDLSTNGTFINGRKIGKHVPSLIFHGDEIQFFRRDLTFTFHAKDEGFDYQL